MISGPTTSRDRPSGPSSHFNEPQTAGHADRPPLNSNVDTSPADPRRTITQRAPEEMTAIIPVIPERSPDEFTAIFDPKPHDHDEMTSIIPPATLAPAPSPMSTAALSQWDIVARKPPQPSCKKIAILSGSAAALLIVIALAVWFLNDDATPSAPPAAPPTTTSAAATTPSTSKPAPPPPPPPAIGIDAVLPLLPPGYPPGACTPDAHPLAGATAAAACGPNAEPAGPIAAQYSVFPQGPSLKAAFDQVTATATAVGCPGGMQSPGPWRRNAAPDVVVGTVFCGNNPDQSPVIAWTDDARALLSVVHPGPDIDLPALFGWWSTHS
jgi:serine/threonine-protein kinase